MHNKPRIYLDYNATAPVRPKVKQAVMAALDLVGNASSIHQEGRKARGLIETAREQLAGLINAQTKEITFTSGGTESNNLVLASNLGALGKKQPLAATLLGATEHPSLIKAQELSPRPVDIIKVDHNGLLDLTHLQQLLAGWKDKSDLPVLVSVMLVNNETGVIQPIDKIVEIVRKFGGFVHLDAVQALGKMPIDFADLNVDLMSLSAHKIGGMLGAGALVIRLGVLVDSYIKGGGQELGLRAGTENIPAIAGFGIAAIECVVDLEKISHYNDMRQKLEVLIQAISADAVIFGQNTPRVATTSCFAIANVTAERALMSLDLAGIAVSSGSACSSGKVSQSHVLKAMGYANDLALCGLRISFGWDTKPQDLDEFITEYTKIYQRMAMREQRQVG
ncbi:MAG: cysteine desulfurase [Hyphomicrobiales bacterium]|nr:cysteine desulfurase [Hyphomicrobiales bacterium]